MSPGAEQPKRDGQSAVTEAGRVQRGSELIHNGCKKHILTRTRPGKE
jgi:hypothetical protein